MINISGHLREERKNIEIMNKEEWLKKGYVAEPVDKTLDLKAEINKLRKEKNVPK